jgi:hypothetical protein
VVTIPRAHGAARREPAGSSAGSPVNGTLVSRRSRCTPAQQVGDGPRSAQIGTPARPHPPRRSSRSPSPTPRPTPWAWARRSSASWGAACSTCTAGRRRAGSPGRHRTARQPDAHPRPGGRVEPG